MMTTTTMDTPTIKLRLILLALVSVLVNSHGMCQQHVPSVHMRILHNPAFVQIDHHPTAYYELHVTNAGNDSIVLRSLDIVTAADSARVLSLNESDLRKRFASMGAKADSLVLLPGDSGMIYLELTMPNPPSRLSWVHRLTFTAGKNPHRFVQTLQLAWPQKPPLVLGPPLGEGIWAAVYEPGWARGHRRVVYTVADKMRIPGRFAIDFIRLDGQGHYAGSDENQIRNWYGYANAVLAVGDGVVLTTRDDFDESPTLAAHPEYSAQQATGNYIALDLGEGNIAFYEHLQPGSIQVKPGQRVKKGQVIAALGFTGQTTGPHLHFHVADANSALGAEGIPFAFEKFTLLGVYGDFTHFGSKPWTPVGNTRRSVRTRQRPAPNSVITFN